MIGFFSKKEFIKNKENSLSIIRKTASEPIENLGCEQCGLWKEVKSPKMMVTGKGLRKTLILAECPGKSEDEQGIQLVGQAGQALRKALEELNFDLDRDFWKTNVVACRPTEGEKNRTPTDLEIKCCRHKWVVVVKELKPDFIFLMGEKAVKSFFMFKGKKIREDLSISRFRKLCIPDLEFNTQVISLYHPSYAVRNPDVLPTFKRDLKWAVNHLGNKRKQILNTDFESQVSSSTIFEEVMQRIKDASKSEYVSIDYETTGLRPFKENQEIVSIGFSHCPNESFSFPFCYPGIWTEEELKLIKNQWTIFLESPAKKIVHSHQMENIWSRHIFGSWENEWYWDTMVVAHILDERDKFTSLDFQVFLHWEFEYGEEIEPFKRSVLNSNFNRMKEAPLDGLLKYNGLDALFTRKLFDLQQEELIKQESLVPAVALFNEGVKCMSEMEYIGIPIDSDCCKQTDSRLALESAMLKNKLEKGEEANLFQKIHQKLPNFNSNSKDLPELLFKILKYKPVKKTIKGKDSVDESVLQELNTDLTNNILRVRKLNKIRNTYLSAFLDSIENKIHPSFNLHLARSFRSSSSNPINFQNIPKKDKDAQKATRSVVVSSPGNLLGEVDFGGHEVRVVCSLSKDKNLIKDLQNGVDIHSLFAEMMGISRFDSKNQFVFAEIYGSNYFAIFKNLLPLYPKLKENTVKKAEEELWKRYSGVRNWQLNLVEKYKKTGHVDMPWGFKRRGYLERNKIFNTPVQGSAFLCLLWSIIEINKIKKKEKWKSSIIGQIHDSMLWDINPNEKDHVLKVCNKIMVEDIMKENPWIIIPFITEWKFSDINGSWFEMKNE